MVLYIYGFISYFYNVCAFIYFVLQGIRTPFSYFQQYVIYYCIIVLFCWLRCLLGKVVSKADKSHLVWNSLQKMKTQKSTFTSAFIRYSLAIIFFHFCDSLTYVRADRKPLATSESGVCFEHSMVHLWFSSVDSLRTV